LRPSALLVSACLALSAGGTAHASGVLADQTPTQPSAIDVQAAVAVTPFGSTRWSRLTVEGQSRVMWLVPARPGAAVDWSSHAWLDALDDATAPRIVRPALPPPSCPMPRSESADRVSLWGKVGTKQAAGDVVVATSEASLRARVEQRGFVMPPEVGTRVSSLYSRGWVLLAIELEARGPVTTSPTIRVSDDGGAVLPLALAGGAFGDTRLTVFTITSGAMTIPGAAEIDPATLTWGADGSDYDERRRALLERHAWLRESSTHEALFDGASLPMQRGVEPALGEYFDEGLPHGGGACIDAARTAAKMPGVVDRTCAPGAVARVPGGAECSPTTGGIDAAAFACGQANDLALALAGHDPRRTFLTRFAGRIPRGSLGEDAELASGAPRSTVIAAGAWERCAHSTDAPGLSPPASRAPPFTGGGEATWMPSQGEGEETSSGEGCAGVFAAFAADEAEEDSGEGCSATIDSSEEGEGGDEGAWRGEDDSDEGESDDAEHDDDDDDDDDNDSDSDDDSSGDDLEPDAAQKGSTKLAALGPKPMKRVEQRRASPVSRAALLLGALVLPLRRRRRDAALDDRPILRRSQETSPFGRANRAGRQM
jgi:hypothetical protein